MSLLTLPWAQFLRELQECEDEALLWQLLNTERGATQRPAVMVRLYQRASKLRRHREHKELLGMETAQ